MLLLAPALALLACTDDGLDTASEAPVRVALIADTHVIGPQYECCSESDGVDNASIVRTAERLESVVAKINAIEPPVDHVFVLGDIVHDAHRSHDPAWYDSEENAFPIAAGLLAGLDAPAHVVWGNHDYEVDCGGGEHHFDREFTHELFDRFFGADPNGVVDDGAWRFVALNSQLGPTWDAEDEQCGTSKGSFGAEQLAWLDDLLSDGRPSVVMTHHHSLTSLAEDENDGADSDLYTVLARHENVAVHFAGHLHRWYDLEASALTPVRQIILGSTRYDDDNFWLAEFADDGTFEILDYEKPQWMTTCADTWVYEGMPTVDPTAEETGDCSL